MGSVASYFVFKSGKDKMSADACVFIFSYDLATRRHEELESKNFKVIIVLDSTDHIISDYSALLKIFLFPYKSSP